jgi:dephospho-CoA kinase
MIVIGITGTLGAGKGTIVDYLVQTKGFNHFSVRAYLLNQIRSLKMPENRDSMFHLANELRAEHGSAYVTDQLYKQAIEEGQDAIIESIRTTGEIASLRKKGSFFLLAVDADPKIRYERIVARKSETDTIDFATFLKNEQRESVSSDPAVQNLQACIKLADIRFDNNGTIPELEQQVDHYLSNLTSGKS